MENKGLCFRCEHRALWMETKSHRPRHECGVQECNKGACYMYQPVKPLVMKRLDVDDPRPEHGGYFGCRMEAVRLPVDSDEMRLSVKPSYGIGESILFWEVQT